MATYMAGDPGTNMEFLLALPAPVSSGVIPNSIVETFANGTQLSFSGNLQEYGGQVVGGDFTSFSLTNSSGVIWSISGFSVSSITLQVALQYSLNFLATFLSGKDTYIGSPTGTDTLIGVSGNDTFIGGNGNETFVPKSGNNLITGGLGYDSIDYSGNSNIFQITDNGGNLTIAKTGETDSAIHISEINFADGALLFNSDNTENFAPFSNTDTIVGNGNVFTVDLSGTYSQYKVAGNGTSATATIGASVTHMTDVGRLQFSDGLLIISGTDPGAEAYRLYQAAFDRTPDNAGLKFWTGELTNGAFTLGQAANFFAGSTEFVAKYGMLDDNGFVTQIYANVLGRSPDPSGFQFWLGYLAAGHSQGDVLVNFSESAENVALVAPHISGGIWIV